MNPNDVDQITDADALLPNGCELISYIDNDGSSTGRTKCAVIVRNGGNSSANGAEPLLSSSQGKQSNRIRCTIERRLSELGYLENRRFVFSNTHFDRDSCESLRSRLT